MKRQPPTIRELALDALIRVERDRAYSNLLLNEILKERELSRSDAALLTEIVYGTIQRLNTLDYFIGQLYAKGAAKLEPWVRALLRVSFYQLVYLDRIPDHAVVSEAVTIAGRRGHKGISGLVNGILRNATRSRDKLTIAPHMPRDEAIAIRHSHPLWLVRRWIRQFGELLTEQICEANNKAPRTSLRVNRLKITPEALIYDFEKRGIHAECSTLSPDGVVVHGGGNMALAPEFEAGLYSIQDESSMLVAEMLAPMPGMSALDCCAAPGGKTAHIAEKMNDQGKVLAFDLHPHKQRLIEAQASRLGHTSIVADTCDAAKLDERFPSASFDRVMLDAPCSGLGVIRRKPDLKWAKSEEDIREISRTQHRLLHAVAGLVKPGGMLVYSTCTLAEEENESMVAQFLGDHPEFSPDQSAEDRLPHLKRMFIAPGLLRILPHEYGTDGFFIAAMRKQGF